MSMAELRECKFLTDRSGRRWINEEQISRAGYDDFHHIDLIAVGGTEYFDVVGYSEKRKAFWVEPISLKLEDEEVSAFVESLGTSESE
jgi:hypothetical protein